MNHLLRVVFHTFGCKVNQFDTAGLAEKFREQGFTVVSPVSPRIFTSLTPAQ